jgi:putative ABC transport system ATP-binding protein
MSNRDRDDETSAPACLLELRDVSRVHGRGAGEVHALRAVSLEVTAGELVAVMGPSGSGKSTLLNLAGALDVPTSGVVTIAGTDVSSLTPDERARLRRRRVGFVFQDLNLIPSLTAVENVMLPREFDEVSTRQARREALESLALVGLEGLAERFPDEMSGGQQQRVAIARAFVGPRRLVLADEPTGALDSVTGDAVMTVLRRRVDAGAGGLLVTHDARQAAYADRIVFLRDGRLVDSSAELAGPHSLLTAPGGPA